MNEKKECCGTCRFHRHHTTDDGVRVYANEWICGNEDSDYYTDFTEYSDSCDSWEGRN